MANSTVLKLRALWLQVHKWIGLLLAVLIIPISVTGSALVWHDGLDEMLNPQRVAHAAPTKNVSEYAAAVQSQLKDGERIATVRMPEGGEGAVQVSAMQAPQEGQRRVPRTTFYVHPETAAIMDTVRGSGGLIQLLHQLHGTMLIPDVGRQVVGWVGAFMLISCLTGIWLWWPVTGSVKRGFRWKRQPGTNANIHHLLGFWVLVPLAMLSFTGVWISFPQTFSVFQSSPPQAAGAPKQAGPPAPARPVEQTAMTADAAVAAAKTQAGDAPLVMVNWPTSERADWTVGFEREEPGTADYRVGDADAKITPPGPAQPETIARVMRRWHDGQGMGLVWQILIFLGGIIPAILSITGIIMWWKARQWRRKLKAKQAKGEPVSAAAE